MYPRAAPCASRFPRLPRGCGAARREGRSPGAAGQGPQASVAGVPCLYGKLRPRKARGSQGLLRRKVAELRLSDCHMLPVAWEVPSVSAGGHVCPWLWPPCGPPHLKAPSPALGMPGVCCQTLPTCDPCRPWAGLPGQREQFSASQPQGGHPRLPWCPTLSHVLGSALCLLLPGGVSQSQPLATPSRAFGGPRAAGGSPGPQSQEAPSAEQPLKVGVE